MYQEQERYRFSDDLVAALRVLTRHVDTAPGPGGSRITVASGIVKPIVDLVFGHEWSSASVVALYPSSQLVAHSDPPLVGRRYHVPLVVNDRCWSFHDGTWQQLVEGHVYEMNPTQVHGAVNWGVTLRLHLIVDTLH